MGNVINAKQDDSEKHVLPSHLGGGPMNLGGQYIVTELLTFTSRTYIVFLTASMIPRITGDPDDRTLRKVEKDILILNLIREKTHKEKCHVEAEGTVKQ